MNKIKHDFDKLFSDESRFSEANEKRVMQEIIARRNTSRKRSWQYPLIMCGSIFLIVLLAVIVSFESNISKEESLALWLQESGADEILYEEMNVLQKEDALVVYKVQTGSSLLVHAAYLIFKDGEWISTDHCTNGFGTEDATVHYLNSRQAPYLYCGTERSNGLKKVIVGKQEGKILEIANAGMFWFAFSKQPVARVVYEYIDGSMQRMNSIEWASTDIDDRVPVIGNMTGQQYKIQYTSNAMNRGNHEYTSYPIVIEPNVENLNRGDVVYVNAEDGTKTIARIVGLPGEKIAIHDGTIIVNTIPLDIYYGFATQMGFDVFEAYIDKLKEDGATFDENEIRKYFFWNMDELPLDAGEYYVAADNWGHGIMTKITDSLIIGKVLGYEALEIANEWSKSERALYDAFREQNDVEIFRDVDPLTIARVQLYAKFLADEQTVYRLYTTRENYSKWSEAEHMRQHTQVEAERNRSWALEMAKAMKNGAFKELPDHGGVILFTQNESDMGYQMVKNENGIWQVAFMPIQ
ncbi:S26 family signal peptidase [Lysinibacillus sp. NPDC093197]|uniref:S26 family signal peptidase n=1 Tax=Lysinibacillus sp. NPDC093197 TaxID=3364132 RepID=UPI0037FA1350